MERPGGSTTPVWLAERLERAEAAGFPLVSSPSRPVIERADPWSAPLHALDLGALLPRIESAADDGRSILVVTDVEEDPVARVHTAVLLARALAAHGRRVLLVDADLRYVGLARWAPQDQMDREGLVDALQYGASVSAVRLPTAVEGIDWIGPGSYRPDSSAVFVDEDLRRVARQLRQQDAVVLVIAGARLAAERFHPWLVHADAVLPAVHLDSRLADDLEDLLGYLGGLNVPVLGLVTFRGPDETEETVDALLAESAPAPARSEAPAEAPGAEGEEIAAQAAVDPGAAAHAAEGPVPASPARAAQEEEIEKEEASSPVFRWILAVVFSGLVLFVGWWAMTQQSPASRPRITPPERSGPLAAHPGGEAPRRLGVDRPALPDTLAGGGAGAGAGGTGSLATGTEREAGSGVSAGGGPVVEGAAAGETGAAEAAAGVSRDDGSERTRSSLPEEGVSANPRVSPATGGEVEPATAGPIRPEPSDAGSADALRSALQREPAPGWAIHVYSFPDSAEALVSVDELRARGFSPIVRGFDLGEKGRWYRVLIGRFPAREDALAAREAAKEELEVDWVGVARLRR